MIIIIVTAVETSNLDKGNVWRSQGITVETNKGIEHAKRLHIVSENNKTPWLESAGANYTDRATAACRRS
jgi:hypothetical protein